MAQAFPHPLEEGPHRRLRDTVQQHLVQSAPDSTKRWVVSPRERELSRALPHGHHVDVSIKSREELGDSFRPPMHGKDEAIPTTVRLPDVHPYLLAEAWVLEQRLKAKTELLSFAIGRSGIRIDQPVRIAQDRCAGVLEGYWDLEEVVNQHAVIVILRSAVE